MPRPLLLAAKGADRVLSVVVLAGGFLSGTSIFVMAVFMAANVISRQVFNKPFLDTVLLGELSVVVLTYMGLAWVFRLGGHVAVRALVSHFPWKTRLWIEVVGLSVSLVGLAVAIYETWVFAYASLQMGERLRGIIRIDAFPFHVLMPLGLALLSLEIVRTIVLDLIAWVEEKPELSPSLQHQDEQAG